VQLEVSCLKKRAQADRVCLQVTDLGVGMTTEQTLRICERFYHLSTVGTTAGRGLGMALAKKIIQRHHGDLRVTSTPQQGTQVVIELLLAAKQD
jgi:signal transduction histidine kinase